MRGVPGNAREAAVDDYAHAFNGQRGLGDGGREHDFPPSPGRRRNREILRAWIQSEVHRTNLFSPPFNATGIGIAQAPADRADILGWRAYAHRYAGDLSAASADMRQAFDIDPSVDTRLLYVSILMDDPNGWTDGIRVARALFAERPYDQVSLPAIAERAGVTVQTVLRRFGSKEDLFAAAAHQQDHIDRRFIGGVFGGPGVQVLQGLNQGGRRPLPLHQLLQRDGGCIAGNYGDDAVVDRRGACRRLIYVASLVRR